MRLIRYENVDGYLYQAWIPENSPASDAEKGVPYNPPDVNRLDWDAIKRELNNLLVKRDIITLKDVDVSGALSGTILSVIQPKLIELYKEQSGYKKSINLNGHNVDQIKEINNA